MKKVYEVKRCSRCGGYTCERELTSDLNCFDVYDKLDDYVAGVYPYDIKEMKKCQEALKDGECPLCDNWENGLGYTFIS